MSKGFAKVPNDIFRLHGKELGADGIGLYTILAIHANGEGVCWPSMKVIAEQLGQSPKTVLGYLHKLIDSQLITVEKFGNNRLKITVCLSKNDLSNSDLSNIDSSKNDLTLKSKLPSCLSKNDSSLYIRNEQEPINNNQEQKPTIGENTPPKKHQEETPFEETPTLLDVPVKPKNTKEEDNILFNATEPALLKPDRDEEFNRFWESSRNKAEKKTAKPAWKKAIMVFKISNDTLIAKYQEYALSQESKGLTTQAAVRWLNGERWNETPAATKFNGGNHHGQQPVRQSKYGHLPVYQAGDDPE